MKMLVFALCTLMFIGMSEQWKNQWDKAFKFQCSDRSAITHIVSKHSNKKEDRLFNFDCTPVGGLAGRVSCQWTGYVNGWDAEFLHTCPNGGYLNGISSIHDNKKEDRRYKFRCCTPRARYFHKDCRWTGWVNDWDATFSYFVPQNKIIRGINSKHSNSKEDRRFKFEACKVANG